VRRRFTLTWDERELAAAFKVTVADIEEMMTDGRRASFIIERRLVLEHPGWQLAKSEGAAYDLIDPDQRMWEVRSVTRGGVYFNPSNQVGSGRRFEEAGFQQKLDGIEGFILTDIVTFPSVDVFVVPIAIVRRWHQSRELGANARVSRARFLERLVPQLAGEE
jgi:hypothetical protein